MAAPPDSAMSAPQRRETAFLKRHGIKLFVSLLLGASLAYVIARGGLPLVPPKEAFFALKPWMVAAYVGSLLVVHFFRASRWRHLLNLVGEVSFRHVIAVSWIGFAAILLAPLRSGEVVRPLLIARRGSVRLWEATGTIGAERVIDGLVLSGILFVSLLVAKPISPLPERVGDLPISPAAVPAATYFVLFLFSIAFVLMGLFFWRRETARHLTQATVGLVSKRLALRASGMVEGLADGLRFLPSPRHIVPFLLETLAYWGSNALGVWILGLGTGLLGFSFAQACVVMGVVGIGILVPAGPGFFGAFQLSTYMALAMFYSEATVKSYGAAFVFLLYGIQFVWHLAAALLGVLIDLRSASSAKKKSAGYLAQESGPA